MESTLIAPMQPSSAQAAAPSPDLGLLTGAFADVRILAESLSLSRLVRGSLLAEKELSEVARNDAASQLRRASRDSVEKSDLYRRIRACTEQEHHIEELIKTQLLPQHGPTQFIGPRAFLQTPLFRVAGKQRARQGATSLVCRGQVFSDTPIGWLDKFSCLLSASGRLFLVAEGKAEA